MATTVHEPPKINSGREAGHRLSDDGGSRGLMPGGGYLRSVDDSSPASRTGIWVGLAAITMTFAAFTSAMVVRQASLDWRHFTLPSMLYLNTAILLMSGVTIEIARKRVTSFARGNQTGRSTSLLW